MKSWYFDIPKGKYTIQEFMNLCNPTQCYSAVYSMFREKKVESIKINPKSVDYNPKNTKVWIWKGAEYYLRKEGK